MTRKRVASDAPQAWHVMSRGSRRLGLYYEDGDCSFFLAVLKTALAASGCVLWAYALMRNHYHLMMYGTSKALSTCMRRLNSLYARYHNRKKALGGHAYEGRYKAYLQPSPLLMLQRIAYIFLNPVNAGFAEKPEDYPWSGYRSFIGMEGSPLEVQSFKPLSYLAVDGANPVGRFSQVMEIEARLSRRRKLYRVPTSKEIQAAQFEWLLEYARERCPKDHGVDPASIAMYVGSEAGIPPRAMALALGERDTKRIRMTLCRLKARAKQDEAFAALLKLD